VQAARLSCGASGGPRLQGNDAGAFASAVGEYDQDDKEADQARLRCCLLELRALAAACTEGAGCALPQRLHWVASSTSKYSCVRAAAHGEAPAAPGGPVPALRPCRDALTGRRLPSARARARSGSTSTSTWTSGGATSARSG